MAKVRIEIRSRKLISGLPFLVGVAVFAFARPAFAEFVVESANITRAPDPNGVTVGSEVGENDFRQIYYEYADNKVFITNSNYTNGEPETDGKSVVWMGQEGGANWHIFLYNIISEETTQLSNSSNNANPKISKGKVVWEGWADGGWQIFLYDGIRVTQLTSKGVSVNPGIDGDYVVYGTKESGVWRTVAYSLPGKKATDVTVGEGAKRPKTKDGKVFLPLPDGGEKEFPLTLDDLFLLGLVPLSASETDTPVTVKEEEIKLEFGL